MRKTKAHVKKLFRTPLVWSAVFFILIIFTFISNIDLQSIAQTATNVTGQGMAQYLAKWVGAGPSCAISWSPSSITAPATAIISGTLANGTKYDVLFSGPVRNGEIRYDVSGNAMSLPIYFPAGAVGTEKITVTPKNDSGDVGVKCSASLTIGGSGMVNLRATLDGADWYGMVRNVDWDVSSAWLGVPYAYGTDDFNVPGIFDKYTFDYNFDNAPMLYFGGDVQGPPNATFQGASCSPYIIYKGNPAECTFTFLSNSSTPKYKCSSTACVRDDAAGTFTSSNCNNTCAATTPKYKCSSNTCVRDDANGTFTSSSCNNTCAATTPKYKCSSNTCIRDDATGTFTSSNCNNTCSGGPTKVNGSCGLAAQAYASSATNFSGAYCSPGTADPANPDFPGQGSSTNWVCKGSNGGTDSETCTATRATPNATPVVSNVTASVSNDVLDYMCKVNQKVTFNWTYSDGDNNPQNSAQVQVDSTTNTVNGAATSLTLNNLSSGSHQYRVRVNDGREWSSWSAYQSFSINAPVKAVDFTYSPTSAIVGQNVTFTASLQISVSNPTYFWTFSTSTTPLSSTSNPTMVKFGSSGSKPVILNFGSSIGSCQLTKTYIVGGGGQTF